MPANSRTASDICRGTDERRRGRQDHPPAPGRGDHRVAVHRGGGPRASGRLAAVPHLQCRTACGRTQDGGRADARAHMDRPAPRRGGRCLPDTRRSVGALAPGGVDGLSRRAQRHPLPGGARASPGDLRRDCVRAVPPRPHDMMSGRAAWSSYWLALRSLLWTLAFPGFFAGYVPWRFFGLSRTEVDLTSVIDIIGLLGMALGVVLL